MRGIFIGLGLALFAAAAASAQTKEQIDLCYSSTATAEQTIDGCTAMIKSGRYSGSELSHAYNNRSTGYSDKGQLDLAIADQTQAIKIDPTNAQAYNNRCQDQSKKGLHDQAIPDCTRALALKPDYANAYANRGYAYEKKGIRDKANADYRAALKINPNHNWAQQGLKRLGTAQ